MDNLKKLLLIQLLLVVVLSVPVYLNTGALFFFVKSNSMYPAIPQGSIILISGREPDLKNLVNKVIVFYNPLDEKVVVHRVVREDKGFLLTRGDNNDFPDDVRPRRKNIFGTVIFILKVPFLAK